MKSAQWAIVHLLSIALVVVYIIGCQSMRTVEESPDSVQRGIADGSLLEEGMWVRVYLTSGESAYFQVDSVTENQIIGHQHARQEGDQTDEHTDYRPWTEVIVPISEVERLERGQFSAGKTAAAGGLGVLWVLILIAVASASLASGI